MPNTVVCRGKLDDDQAAARAIGGLVSKLQTTAHLSSFVVVRRLLHQTQKQPPLKYLGHIRKERLSSSRILLIASSLSPQLNFYSTLPAMQGWTVVFVCLAWEGIIISTKKWKARCSMIQEKCINELVPEVGTKEPSPDPAASPRLRYR